MRSSLITAALVALLSLSNAQAAEPLQGPAFQHADAAFRLQAAGDYAAAEREVQQALQLAPGHPQLLRQLAELQQRLHREQEAEQTLTKAIEQQPENALLYLERAYLRYALQSYRPAIDDFNMALSSQLEPARMRSARLGLADAALAVEDAQTALSALQPIGELDYAVWARKAMAERLLEHTDAAVAAWREAEAATGDPKEKATAIRSRAELLRDAGRDDEAFQEVLDGVARYPDNRGLMLDAAYIAVAAGDDPAALERFRQGAEDPDAPANALVDAAYTANRLAESRQAAEFFRLAIDRHYDEDPAQRTAFTEQQWFGMRRQIQEIEREFGFQLALFHRGNAFVPGVAGDDVWQASAEVFWQPESYGYRGGRILQWFLRGIQTLDAPGLQDSSESRLLSFGARYKPFPSLNLVVTAERVLGIGDLVEDDWLLRAGYSYDHGIDLQPWNRSWNTVNGFVEAVRFLDAGRTVIGAQGRLGRSFAFGHESWVLLPHIGLSLDYDSALNDEFAGGIGPGIAIRYWHRGDRFWAPPSYVDLQIQYRSGFGDDAERSEGLAAQLIWYY